MEEQQPIEQWSDYNIHEEEQEPRGCIGTLVLIVIFVAATLLLVLIGD